jgi:pimeloyl-ACP methyl ester carboxylesterase
MAYYDKGEGLPVVFCHGFPELAYSWRNQIHAVAEAGYRAIAPDQRGYGLTERPEGMENYTIKHLCDDMAGLLDGLGLEKAVFCGHDWGGGVVWMMPRMHPDRVAGVIGINTPTGHPLHPRENDDSLIVMSDRYYVNTFQEPGVAEAVLEADVRRSFDFMLRKGGIWDVEKFQALSEDSPERRLDLLAMIEKGDFLGEPLLPDRELQYFIDTFEVTGFTGGLNWYRASRQIQAELGELQWDIGVPSLYIGAENDVILRPSSADGMKDFIADFETHTVADCGHWTQQEKPQEVNRVVIGWLDKKFA